MDVGTYKIKSVLSSTRGLRLFAPDASTEDGWNVVIYTSNNTVVQKWYFDGSRLLSGSNRKYCLDRYTASNHLDNADIWEALSSENANQKVDIVSSGSHYKIRLHTKVGNHYYYLTAYSSNNGTKTGKSTTSSGNAYWAESTGGNNQLWDFTSVSAPSGAVTLNGIKVPLPEYPVGSYWTIDGTSESASKYFSGATQCAGFAKYIYYCMWGSVTYGSSVTQKDPLSGTASDFNGISVGARINCDKVVYDPGEDPNHSMVLIGKTSTGVTVYDANWSISEDCIVGKRTWTYADFADIFSNIKSTSYTP